MMRLSSESAVDALAMERVDSGSGHITAQLVTSLLESAQRALPPSALEAEQYILRACQLLLPKVAADVQHASPTGTSPLAPWQIGPVERWIEAHLADVIRIERLAALVNLSHGHFSRAFRRTVGESPIAYIRRRRIEHAQQLMLTTRRSLAQIALDCGLADQCHLTRVFRRVAGTTPGNWRRQATFQGTPEGR